MESLFIIQLKAHNPLLDLTSKPLARLDNIGYDQSMDRRPLSCRYVFWASPCFGGNVKIRSWLLSNLAIVIKPYHKAWTTLGNRLAANQSIKNDRNDVSHCLQDLLTRRNARIAKRGIQISSTKGVYPHTRLIDWD